VSEQGQLRLTKKDVLGDLVPISKQLQLRKYFFLRRLYRQKRPILMGLPVEIWGV
jgi:hypothetical protein